MEELKIFNSVAKDPHKYAGEYKKKHGKKIIGYLCTYTPEEFIWAAGALPFRIFGTRENISLADAHIQTYCCSLVRGSLEEALAGKLGFLDGTVFPHTCDSIQRLSDIWRINAGFPLHLDVILPVKLNTESARDYLKAVFAKFRRDLENNLGVKISDAALRDTIVLYNKIRKSLAEIYELRSVSPGIISGSEMYNIIKSSMVMDKKEFLEHIGKAIVALKKRTSPVTGSAKRIMIAGGVCNHPDIYSLLEQSGGVVVWDELCTGTRYFEGQIDENSDPLNAVAARYTDRMVCPAKHSTDTARGENLVRLAREQKIDGVLFLILKFCDPHSFDYPYMKEYLDREKVPSMLLEIEEQLPPEGQLKTRFETFIGMI